MAKDGTAAVGDVVQYEYVLVDKYAHSQTTSGTN